MNIVLLFVGPSLLHDNIYGCFHSSLLGIVECREPVIRDVKIKKEFICFHYKIVFGKTTRFIQVKCGGIRLMPFTEPCFDKTSLVCRPWDCFVRLILWCLPCKMIAPIPSRGQLRPLGSNPNAILCVVDVGNGLVYSKVDVQLCCHSSRLIVLSHQNSPSYTAIKNVSKLQSNSRFEKPWNKIQPGPSPPILIRLNP